VRGDATPVAFDSCLAARGALVDAARNLSDVMRKAEDGRRRRSRSSAAESAFATALESILCNLALVEAVAPGRVLSIRRGKMARTFSPAFGAPFNDVVDQLERMGFAVQAVGHRGTLTTLAVCPPLRGYLPAHVTMADIAVKPTGDVLSVRAAKADWCRSRLRCAVPDNAEAIRLRAEMVAVNEWLSRANLTLDGAHWWLREPENTLARIVTTHHVRLARVFNNGTLAHGGRMFGGFWQTMPKAERLARIRIDGQQVAELDFRAMVPRLCYARLGVPWPFDGDTCAYTAGPDADRDAWKELTNAMLAARRRLRGWPGASPDDCQQVRGRFRGRTLADATAAVRRHHSAFADAGGFHLQMNMQAMRAESDIAVAVVLALKAEGVVALPVHDAFIVREADAARAAAVMRACAREVSGADILVEAVGP
jgi:hypothetical protein